MFTSFFSTVLRSVAIPIVAFIIISPLLGQQAGFLVVTITVTIVNILSMIFQAFKIIPNLMFLKMGRIIRIFISVFIEIASIIGFWLYYLANFR